MSPSDIATYTTLLDKGGTVAVLIAVVLALAALVRWLLKQLLERRDSEIAYRDAQIDKLQSQLERQQDLFDQALDMLAREPRRGAARGGR